MGATYLDEKGTETLLIMGCYGIGINRIVASAVEAGHDENGIIWPLSIAPYHVLLVPLPGKDPAVMERSLALESALTSAGLDVLIDDRDQRPGFKFKDADLIGIPFRVVIGERRSQGGEDRDQVAQPVGGQAGPRRHGGGGDSRGDRDGATAA